MTDLIFILYRKLNQKSRNLTEQRNLKTESPETKNICFSLTRSQYQNSLKHSKQCTVVLKWPEPIKTSAFTSLP